MNAIGVRGSVLMCSLSFFLMFVDIVILIGDLLPESLEIQLLAPHFVPYVLFVTVGAMCVTNTGYAAKVRNTNTAIINTEGTIDQVEYRQIA